MGKIIASYLVRITLREPDDLEDGEPTPEPPTNAALAELITEKLGDISANVPTVTSERLDI